MARDFEDEGSEPQAVGQKEPASADKAIEFETGVRLLDANNL